MTEEGARFLGPELRALRGKLGLSQKDMAARFKIGLRHYQRYERGEYPVTLLVRHAIAHQLQRGARPWPDALAPPP